MSHNFLPNITSLGRPTRPHDNHGDGPRDLPDVDHWPYETTPGARARLVQDTYIPRRPSSNLVPPQSLFNRTAEQARLLNTVHQNIHPGPATEEQQPPVPEPPGTPIIPQPSIGPQPSTPAPERLMSPAMLTTEQTPETPHSTGSPLQSTPNAVISTNSSTNNASGSSSDQNISISPAVSSLSKKMTLPAEPPLACGPILFRAPPVQEQNSIETVTGDEHIRLRSEGRAPVQPEEFYQFVYTLTEYYNGDPVNIHGLKNALNPLITQDQITKRFEVRKDLLTHQNVKIIDILMKDHAKKKTSIFDINNPTLKTILKRFNRNN